jgi:hypothetical protein
MICAWCESQITGKPVEVHRGPIPRRWLRLRPASSAITALGDAFAASLAAAWGDRTIEHFDFHPECWEQLSGLLHR